MNKIDKKLVEQVINNKSHDIDVKLHALGKQYKDFVVVNPMCDPWILDYLDTDQYVSDSCIVWHVDNTWIAKKFTSSWTTEQGWHLIDCELDLDTEIEINPELSFLKFDINKAIPFADIAYEYVYYLDSKFSPNNDRIWVARVKSQGVNILGEKDAGTVSPEPSSLPQLIFNKDIPHVNYDSDFQVPYFDLCYENVWYLNPNFKHEDDKIWVAKFLPLNPIGFKDRGYVSPKLEFNPDIPKVAFDSNFSTVYQDLCYEHIWYLDQQFNTTEDEIWLAKITPEHSQGVKHMGYVKPVIEFNPDIPKVAFDSNFSTVYQDLCYEHIWYLDQQFNTTEDEIWLAKITSINSQGVKHMGYVKPVIEFNPDIPDIEFEITDQIPYFDLGYEHVWMLDSNLHTDDETIWAAKIVPLENSLGVKQVGNIKIHTNKFDVIFISYNEPNAEANWQRVLEKAPYAKRVKGVKGIFEAHKKAAELAKTKMFYVVDGDAELDDSWEFNFKVNIFDTDCVHLWTSLNPINGLEYGYGGVKLFPRQLLLDSKSWKVDLTTGLGKLKLLNRISNITAFNYDEFTTWRSAFRECAKLSSSLEIESDNDADTVQRLKIWTTVGREKPMGEFAIAGAIQGKKYGRDNYNDIDKLKLINDYEWLRNKFEEEFKKDNE